jgi:hypothetical protein
MDNLQRIQITSRWIKKICSVLIFCLPLLLAFFWIFANNFLGARPLPFINYIPDHLTGSTRFLAFLAEMIPLSAVVYGLLRLRELFRLYENEMIFTENNVSCFRRLGWALIVWVECDVIKTPLLSLILTMDSPGGHRGMLAIASPHIACILVGIVILIIAWVMDEARKIHEDQSLFI